MNKYNLYLKLQEPIEFYDVCIIHQLSLSEILGYKYEGINESGELTSFKGIEAIEKLLIPYCITTNMLEGLTEEELLSVNNFDLIGSLPEIISYLIPSLEFFCKSKIDYDQDGFFFEGFTGRLNRNNFDEFAEIILKICGRERPKIERPPEFKNDRQKDIWHKLQEGRKRFAKTNEVMLEDIINYCEFGGKSYIPVEEIKKWTIWRVMNCYKSILGRSSYDDSFSIYLVSGEKSLIEDKHWTDFLKLNYQYKE